jgi:hypothetical protein
MTRYCDIIIIIFIHQLFSSPLTHFSFVSFIIKHINTSFHFTSLHRSLQRSDSSCYRCSLREKSLAIARFLVLLEVSFLASCTAVPSVTAALQHSRLAVLITATAASARLRDLTILGHSNQCEAALAIVKAKREAHDETSNAIVRLNACHIEPAASDEASSTSQVIMQRSIPLILDLIRKRPLVDAANAQHQFLAVHPSLSAHVARIIDAFEVERRLES